MRETNLASLISEVLTEKNNPYVALLRLYSLLTCYALHAKGNMYRLPDNITILILVHLIVLQIALPHQCLQVL